MDGHLFREELNRFRELATEFAAAYPALAPFLGAPPADADVERLLEGVAYQHALLRAKLRDDFPESVHDLVRLLCPHYLRPIPSTTIVAFTPHPSLACPETVPAGTQLASVPVEGISCLFRTCSAVQVDPLEIVDATFAQPAGEAPAITLLLALRGPSLAQWSLRRLRLFLGGEYAAAADLYFLLCRHLQRIVIAPEEGGQPLTLPPDALLPAGLAAQEGVIPYPSHAFPGYRLLQEYFHIPRCFLFLDLTGPERWVERGCGSRFTIRFELNRFRIAPPVVKRESFVLFAASAVNLFSHDANPVRLDHRQERYLVRPAGLPPEHAQVYSVDRVTGYGTEAAGGRGYHPFELFTPPSREEPAYHTTTASSARPHSFDVYLSFPYPKGVPEEETLSIGLTCTNGVLPQGLRIGDLCHLPASTRAVTVTNVTPVTPAVLPPLGEDLLRRLVSHLTLARSSFTGVAALRALLELYLFEEGGPDLPASAANRRRIEGIEEVAAHDAELLVRGLPVRGRDIRVRVRGDHFAGAGDLFHFGSVLDRSLGVHAAINSFTQLSVTEVIKGETVRWPPRLGARTLP